MTGTQRKPRRRIDRVSKRPNPEDWLDDQHMTLQEALAVFWPDGPLTIASLRTEIRRGTLSVERIAGKFLVTPRDIREMRARCVVKPPERCIPPETSESASSSKPARMTPALKRALEQAQANIKARREYLRKLSKRP